MAIGDALRVPGVAVSQRVADVIDDNLGLSSSPTIVGLTLTGLTASQYVKTNGSKALASQSGVPTTDLTGTLTTWTPTVTGSGTLAVSGLAVYDKSYEKAGNWVHFQLAIAFNLSGTGTTIYATLPSTPIDHDSGSLYAASTYICSLQNSANASGVGRWHVTGGKIEVFIFGGVTNMGTAGATYIAIDGKYRVA